MMLPNTFPSMPLLRYSGALSPISSVRLVMPMAWYSFLSGSAYTSNGNSRRVRYGVMNEGEPHPMTTSLVECSARRDGGRCAERNER